MQGTVVSEETVTLSQRQECLRDIAHLRKQCDRVDPSDSKWDQQACPMRRELDRLLNIVVRM
jgi:hypothetical protein